MILVADASLVLKVLLIESGSDLAQQWWADGGVTWASPVLVMSEVEAAIQAHHRRHGDVFPEDRRRQASAVWREMASDMQLHTVDPPLAASAVTAVQRHGPMRGADAVYLAVALELRTAVGDDVVLGSFDHQQRRAADLAGVAVAPGRLPTAGSAVTFDRWH